MSEAGKKRVRTCIGCGKQSDKVELMRIARLADGRVEYDETGRMPGRGAYVCSSACFEEALEHRKVARALRCEVDAQAAARVAFGLEKAQLSAVAR